MWTSGRPTRTTRQAADVIAWRQQQLTAAGFDPMLAAQLARDRRWDLHALLELVERGCPPPLAARILAPPDDIGVDL
jgi:hypothetical protein